MKKKSFKTGMEAVDTGNERGLLVFLALTSLVCGAAVMIIEVLGSRVIGPFFGASLYVWTSLITVTLVALASGYWSGGILSDRCSRPRSWLFGIIALAGCSILLIPVLKAPAIKLALPLGLRIGSLASSGMLFGPSLLLLGMVSPFIIRIAALEMASIGRTVGLFSSISTAGSFIGTVGTGFVLIAYFPIDRIFIVVGGVLLLVSACYALLYRRSGLLLPLLILPFLVPVSGGPKSKLLPNGTTLSRVFFKESFYGNIQVHEYASDKINLRELVVDATIQGGTDTINRQSIHSYTYFQQFIPRIINPLGKDCLVVGLGPGVIPVWYEQQGVRTDVVDIDPVVFDVARRFFGFAVSGETYAEDARYFLSRPGKQYDYIILDVFNGDNTPFHVLSKEALHTVKQRLKPGGVLGINIFAAIRGETYMTASVVRTLKEVFKTVDIFPGFTTSDPSGIGNLELFAHDRQPVVIRPDQLAHFQVHPLVANVRTLMLEKFEFPEQTPSMVLTDSYNPIDFFDVRTKEYSRRRTLEFSDIDFLLG
ncbi:MAG: spermidine synthase [Geobacteraceae bacterium]|nr:spermidine synthase [Geobacteraceae bacterium]